VSVFKSTIQITVLSFINIILHFVLQLVVAYCFGTTSERDAYFAAMVIPVYLIAVTSNVGVIFLPMYVDICSKQGQEEADKFFHNVVSIFGVAVLLLVLVVAFFSERIIPRVVPGFTDIQLRLTIKLMLILLPTVFLSFIITIAGSVLQVQKHFFISASGPVVSVVVSLGMVWMFHNSLGILSLAYGSLLGSIINCLFIRIAIYKRLVFIFRIYNRHIIMLLKSSIPAMTSSIIFNFSKIFERIIGSGLPGGSISYLGYAHQLMSVLATIVAGGIAVAMYPLMAKAWSEQDLSEINRLLVQAIRVILLLALPIAVVCVFWGIPIIQILLERGAFTHNDTSAVSSAFTILTVAFIAGALGNITSKCYYFSHKTTSLAIIDIISMMLYLIMAVIFSRHYSYKGLAMASSASSLFSLIMQIVFLKRIIDYAPIRSNFKFLLFILFVAFIPILVMEIFLKIAHINVTPGNIPMFIVIYCCGYYFILNGSKIEEVNILRKRIIGSLFGKRASGYRQ
jgi:putative peptidoglycan lipid II flippase